MTHAMPAVLALPPAQTLNVNLYLTEFTPKLDFDLHPNPLPTLNLLEGALSRQTDTDLVPCS